MTAYGIYNEAISLSIDNSIGVAGSRVEQTVIVLRLGS